MRTSVSVSVFLIAVMGLFGCASAPGHRKSSLSNSGIIDESIDDIPQGNVYTAVKALLDKGKAVNVIVDYQSSYKGMPDGCIPADFGCDADRDTIIETEKLFLLDAFSRYPNFSVIDRSQLNASFAEKKLGMSGVIASDEQQGGISGASHLVIIEGRNHFFRLNGKNKDRYTEIKKLLDIQKNVVMAMDKLSEDRDVEYHRTPREESEPVSQIQDPSPVQQAPAVAPVEVVSVPSGPAEVISIHGTHREYTDAEQPVQQVYVNPEVRYETTIVRQNSVQPPVNSQGIRFVRRIPDWQFARIVKQRFPSLKNKDNGAVVRRYIQKHPEFKERIISTDRRVSNGS